MEQWAQMMSSGRPEFEREAEAGSYALETLLEQQVDKAFDKFTAYALRNIFSVPDGVELVMVSFARKLVNGFQDSFARLGDIS